MDSVGIAAHGPPGAPSELASESLGDVTGGRGGARSSAPVERSRSHDPAFQAPRQNQPGRLLLSGFTDADAAALRPLLPELDIQSCPVDSILDSTSLSAAADVICFGDRWAPEDLCRVLQEPVLEEQVLEEQVLEEGADTETPSRCRHCRHIVLAAGTDLTLFQDLVDGERIYYLTPSPPPPAVTAALVRSALRTPSPLPEDDLDPLLVRSIVELVGRLAHASRPEQVVRQVSEEAARWLEAAPVTCALHDVAGETLWHPGLHGLETSSDRAQDFEERDSTASGLVGFVARTGHSVRLARVGEDPRWDAEADTPRGDGGERFLAVPIQGKGHVLAVLSARRPASAPAFEPRQQQILTTLAHHLSPVLARLDLARLDLARRLTDSASGDATSVFRSAARAHHDAGFVDQGRPIRLLPEWTGWALALLITVAVTVGAFAVFGSMHQYASGAAVVQWGDRLDVTTRLSGTVDSVPVAAGQAVKKGDPIAHLDADQEIAEWLRLQAEYEQALAQRLRDPFGSSTGTALGSLRSQRSLAAARLEARSIRAPQDGVLSDVRVRAGHLLRPGETVAGLVAASQASGAAPSRPTMVAFLPGHTRPQLQPGMALRLELQGYADADLHVVIDQVGDEVIGPAEAARLTASASMDAVPLAGPVVWVRAVLPTTFTSEGRSYPMHQGIQGTAEVRLRSEPILSTLLPGLDRFFGDRAGDAEEEQP